MNHQHVTYAALVCGTGCTATLSLVEDHPVVLALSFPFGALAFAVVWLAAGWRPRRGR